MHELSSCVSTVFATVMLHITVLASAPACIAKHGTTLPSVPNSLLAVKLQTTLLHLLPALTLRRSVAATLRHTEAATVDLHSKEATNSSASNELKAICSLYSPARQTSADPPGGIQGSCDNTLRKQEHILATHECTSRSRKRVY